jgi:hypothetical protein
MRLTPDIRVRTLYAYEGQREVDLSFKENVVIIAHPAKDPSSPWWYGTVVDGGKSGWFPHSYVEEMKGGLTRHQTDPVSRTLIDSSPIRESPLHVRRRGRRATPLRGRRRASHRRLLGPGLVEDRKGRRHLHRPGLVPRAHRLVPLLFARSSLFVPHVPMFTLVFSQAETASYHCVYPNLLQNKRCNMLERAALALALPLSSCSYRYSRPSHVFVYASTPTHLPITHIHLHSNHLDSDSYSH